MKFFSLKLTFSSLWLLVFLLAPVMTLSAQERTVTGRISDEKGELLIGIAVQEKGTSNGVVTNDLGEYTLNLTTENPVLVVSSLGYVTQEIPVNNRRLIDVNLAEDVSELDEIVVVGYGTQRKISVVGSQSTMKTDEIKMPTANLSSAIQGRLAGVVAVQRSGEPGHDGSDIWIRGISTFTGQSSSPLVRVDGVERDFNNIDPEDIESFTVLKDASATAVYGVRGANGVIIIKTKPGKVGKPQFSVDYYESLVTMTRRPELADAYTYMDAANEAYMDTNGSLLYTPQYIEATKKANGLLPNDNPKMYNKYLYPAVNWMDEIFNKFGRNRRVNMSVRGGVPNATYYVSLTYYNERGLTRTAEMENYDANMRYDRYNYTANLNLRPTETTTIDLGFSGYLSSGNYPQESTSSLFSSSMAINPVYLPLMMPDGSIPGISTNGDLRNPYADLTRRGYTNEISNQLNSNIRVTQDLGFWNWSEGLSANALLAFDVTNTRNMYYTKRESTYYFDTAAKDSATGLWTEDVFNEDGSWRINRTYQGSDELGFSKTQYSERSTYFEASLNYNRTFGKHNVTAMFLYNQKVYTDRDPGDIVASLPYKQQGIAARATYSYDDRYLVELNAGYNGSENFAPEKRFGFFPAAGLGWVISQEKFWGNGKFSDIFSFLKVRASFSAVGSSYAAYLTKPYYEYRAQNHSWDSNHRFPNDNLKPEQTNSWEVGLNARFFDGKVNLDATWYLSDTYNQTFESTPASTSGYSSVLVQAGQVRNTGLELLLSYQNTWKDFSWNTSLTYTMNRNKIMRLADGVISPVDGKPIDMPYLEKATLGDTGSPQVILYEGGTMGDLYINRELRTDGNGNIYVDPQTNQVELAQTERRKVASLLPLGNLGWSNSFSYRGLTLNVMITARLGGSVVSNTEAILDYYGVSERSAAARAAGGVRVNNGLVDAKNYYQTIGAGTGAGAYYIYDATNVRLQELSLAYTLPKKWFKDKLAMTVSLIGRNLWMIYNKAPFDPELTTSTTDNFLQGVDYFMMPSQRNLGFSVKFQF